MRKFLALSCCALYLSFGFMVGAAHVHGAAGHHAEMRGGHVDHAHLGGAHDHGPHVHPPRTRSEAGEPGVDERRVADHDGDAIYLGVTAHRWIDPGLRVLPATIVVRAAVDVPAFVSVLGGERSKPLRAPPRAGPAPPRAPPA